MEAPVVWPVRNANVSLAADLDHRCFPVTSELTVQAHLRIGARRRKRTTSDASRYTPQGRLKIICKPLHERIVQCLESYVHFRSDGILTFLLAAEHCASAALGTSALAAAHCTPLNWNVIAAEYCTLLQGGDIHASR